MRRFDEVRIAAGREEGFTVFEMLVASMLLVVGMMATLQAFDASGRNTLRVKQSQVMLNMAQQEMEKIRALPYSKIALTVLPSHSADPASPAARVSGGLFNLNPDPSLPRNAELVYNGANRYGGGSVTGGTVAPETANVTSGDLTMRIYRYVVWQRDLNCPNTAPAGQPSCPGDQDFKRVIVAVRLTGGGGQIAARPYVETQSDFIDPTKSAVTDPAAGPQGVVSAQQFWLSDTPCAPVGTTARGDVSADHPLHNTLGTCATGPTTGTTTPGAPDALLTSAPPDPFLDDPTLPGIFDYSNDFYLEPSPPDGDRGVQIRRQDASGCAGGFTPGGANPESKTHRWVSDPMPAPFAATGKATLEFYTAAINNALHSGSLCVYLFRRTPGNADQLINNAATGLPFFSYQPPAGENWPRATPTASDPLGWKKVRFDMSFAAQDIQEGHRLGIALSTERSGTTFDAGLQILYDHHLTPSRIEVETTTPLDLAGIPSLQISNPTVTTLPATINGTLRNFAAGQTVTYRLDDPSAGQILTATTTPTPTSSGSATVSLSLPAGVANGTHTIYAIGSLGDFTGRQISVNVTRVNSTAIVKTTGCTPGYIKRGGEYYVYADIAGTPSSVTANVGSITANQTAAPLVAGNYYIDGELYNYRSALLTAGSTLAAGSIAYTVTPAGGAAASSSTVLDPTAPTPVDVQTTNKTGGVAGLPEPGDSVTLTYSEPIEPCSLVAGWDGDGPTDVITYIDDAGSNSDALSFWMWNGTAGVQVPLGSVNLGSSKGDYTGTSNAIFGFGGTPGQLSITGNQIKVVLGSLYSGSVKAGTAADVMRWTPSSAATDYAGNAGATTTVLETGVSDKEF